MRHFEAEFLIPPDKSIDQYYHLTIDRDPSFLRAEKEFELCQNIFDGDTTTRSYKSGGKRRKNWKKRQIIKDSLLLSLIPHFSYGVTKSRVRRRCFSQPFAKLRALFIAEMIDKGEESMEAFTKRLGKKDRGRRVCTKNRRCLASIDRQSITGIEYHLTVSIDTHIKSSYTVFPC